MKVMCVLLLLSVAVVYQVEGGWWGKATSFIGNAAMGAVSILGKKERRRRALVEELDADAEKKVDTFCSTSHMDAITSDGLPLEMVLATFKEVNKDKDQNDALSLEELGKFLEAVDIYEHCMKKKAAKGKTG